MKTAKTTRNTRMIVVGAHLGKKIWLIQNFGTNHFDIRVSKCPLVHFWLTGGGTLTLIDGCMRRVKGRGEVPLSLVSNWCSLF